MATKKTVCSPQSRRRYQSDPYWFRSYFKADSKETPRFVTIEELQQMSDS